MKTLLIVDDEKLFTQSLSEGLAVFDPSLRVLAAENGRVALSILEREPIDLVLTDLKMPVVDGFELLAEMSRRYREIPVLVMTAFGTPEIGSRLEDLGIGVFIEKPVDFAALASQIRKTLEGAPSGFVRGIALPTFLQILEIERKTCTLRVSAAGRTGLLHFVDGTLVDAEAEGLAHEEAALEIVRWGTAEIEIQGASGRRDRRIASSLSSILLESFRAADEAEEELRTKRVPGDAQPNEAPPGAPESSITNKEGIDMADVQETLKELAAIDGFAGAGIFTPKGETLAVLAAGTGFSKEIGVLANAVLMNAQKATIEMGAGRGQQVHVEGEKAHILARCLNEGTDPLASQPGKAHIHLVLALKDDSAIGLAKMRLNSVAAKVAPDFRG